MTTEYVYFIEVGPYVKVGNSQNPARRCERLFSSSTGRAAPWDCPKGKSDRHLLGFVEGDLGDELYAHRALELYAVGCEFFLRESAVLEYVAACLAAGHVLLDTVPRSEGQAEFVGQVEPLSAEEQADSDGRLHAALAQMFGGVQ